jgi:hypothetical protein
MQQCSDLILREFEGIAQFMTGWCCQCACCDPPYGNELWSALMYNLITLHANQITLGKRRKIHSCLPTGATCHDMICWTSYQMTWKLNFLHRTCQCTMLCKVHEVFPFLWSIRVTRKLKSWYQIPIELVKSWVREVMPKVTHVFLMINLPYSRVSVGYEKPAS